MSVRIKECFEKVSEQNRCALVTFFMGGDPNLEASKELFKALPANGVDIIEIGMPFSDPMADGPAIEAAANRALDAGIKMSHILDLVRDFRQSNNETPIILMGYANPIFHYGVDAFMKDASDAGIDGLIIVDIPPEEGDDFVASMRQYQLDFIRLIAPTTDDQRLGAVVKQASGFLYYVAVAGITGTKSASSDDMQQAVARLKKQSDLPVALGFGIKTPEHIKNIRQHADAVVVGSELVKRFEEQGLEKTLAYIGELSKATRR